MAHIVVCGGSVVGLSLAMMLAGDGHRVTVLERDAAPPPADPWDGWARPGVAQFHQPHNLLARSRHVLDDEFPGMVDRLVAAGCVWVDWLAVMPPLIRDRSPRPGDDRFRMVTGRRPVIEAVIAGTAAETAGVEVRRGVTAAGLVAAGVGTPHVTGVRTGEGEELAADLVVDAMGRRSRLGEWLIAAGGTPPYVESEDCGFVYYTRYFRGPELPAFLAPPVSEMGTFSLLTLPGDNGTWSVTMWTAADDTALRGLRDTGRFAAVVGACPAHAHWLEGEPITGVLTTAGVVDRYRRMVVDGAPVATGIVAAGDAWACTNPSAGRGITVGLIHAQCVRDVVRAHIGDPDPGVLARAVDEATEARVTPFYRDQIAADRARFAQMTALRRGEEPPAPDPRAAAIAGAVMRDPDVFRAMLESVMCLALPGEVFARPEFNERVDAVGRTRIWKIPGPNRAALLELAGG